jgi:hypothetical protein
VRLFDGACSVSNLDETFVSLIFVNVEVASLLFFDGVSPFQTRRRPVHHSGGSDSERVSWDKEQYWDWVVA